MASFTEPNYLDDILHWEGNKDYSREVVTLAAPSGTPTYLKGQVLGIKTADSKFYPSTDGTADGLQNAAAILLADTTTNTTGVNAVVLRRHAIVVASGLVWDATYTTQGKKDAAIAALKALGIITKPLVY